MRANNFEKLLAVISTGTDDEVRNVAKMFCIEVNDLLSPYRIINLSDLVAVFVSRKEGFERFGKNLESCLRKGGNPSVGEARAFLTGVNRCKSEVKSGIVSIFNNVLMDVWAPECESMRESGLYPEEAVDALDDLLVVVGNNLAAWAYEAEDLGISLIEAIFRKECVEDINNIARLAENLLRVMYAYGISEKRMSLFDI